MNILAAKVLKPHGLHGLLKVAVYLDNWDQYLNYIQDGHKNVIHIVKHQIINHKKNYYLIQLQDIHTLESAIPYMNHEWFIDSTHLKPEEPDKFYYFKLIGLPVKDMDKNVIGKIDNIMTIGGGDVVVVHLNINKEVYLPFDTYTFPVVENSHLTISNEGLRLIFK